MVLVSVIPLASKSCLRRSFISSTHELKPLCRTIPTLGRTHELKPLCRTIPTLGMWRRGKYFTPSIKMCLRTTVSDDDSVQRRVADYHSNIWDDGFIQSLSTPYEAPSYRERADTLILEVKDIFNSMSAEDGELISPLSDLLQRLWMVDSVERLGIYRHFKQEIKSVLDYVYSYWNNEKGIGCGRDSVATDLNSTALGFRIFRLHGYRVSSHVLEHFKDQEGQFACSTIQSEGEIRSVLNLFRASLIAFSGEKVMEEAEMFTTIYLKETLQKIPVSSLSHEIEYALEYGWHTNLPRLEARNYIDVFGRDPISQTTDMTVEKLLELSKLEFNIFHSLQQKELKHVSRWWKDSGFSQLTFTRHRHVEFYTLASCIAIEPEHSAFRLGFAKVCHIGTVLDDIYDTFGRMEELELFTAAVKRWHPSATKWLPEYMKGMYKVLYETINEMVREAEKCQGRDTLNDARQAWEAYIDSYMKEAKWISSGYLPTFDEYLENGKVSFGYRIAVLQPILMLGISFPPHILQEIGYPSKLNDLACSILRIKGDIRTYQAERSRGEKASCISCYMKDNPESTEEDAVTEMNAMVDNKLKELNWEFVRPDNNVPMSSRKHAFDILRALYYLYKYRDGISVTRKEIQNLVTRVVLEPVPL